MVLVMMCCRSSAHHTPGRISYPHEGSYFRNQLAALLLDPFTSDGRRKLASVAGWDWAPNGESPATSNGPTGLFCQLLTESLRRDGCMDVIYVEACIFSAAPLQLPCHS